MSLPCGRIDCTETQPCLTCYPRTATTAAYERHKAINSGRPCARCGTPYPTCDMLFRMGSEYDEQWTCRNPSCGHTWPGDPET